jgi:hypothetical protein
MAKQRERYLRNFSDFLLQRKYKSFFLLENSYLALK